MNATVEIYWNGRAYDFDGNAKEPNDDLHEVWRQADLQGLRVIGVSKTDGAHHSRSVAAKPSKTNAELEADYERYVAKVEKPEVAIKVKP